MVVEEHDVIAPLLQPGKIFLTDPHHIQLELGAIRFQMGSPVRSASSSLSSA